MDHWLGVMFLGRNLPVRLPFCISQTFSQALTSSRYVAMHSMAEATSTHSQEDPTANGYMDAYPGRDGLSKSDISIVTVGMLLPLITQIGHAHAH